MRRRLGLPRPWPGSLAWRSHAHRASHHHSRYRSARLGRIGLGRLRNACGGRERAQCPRADDERLHGHQHVPPQLTGQPTTECAADPLIRGASVTRAGQPRWNDRTQRGLIAPGVRPCFRPVSRSEQATCGAAAGSARPGGRRPASRTGVFADGAAFDVVLAAPPQVCWPRSRPALGRHTRNRG
jgi:hypothetical protein